MQAQEPITMTQYFWIIVPGKTQCWKTGATDEGLYINLQQEFFTRKIGRNIGETS